MCVFMFMCVLMYVYVCVLCVSRPASSGGGWAHLHLGLRAQQRQGPHTTPHTLFLSHTNTTDSLVHRKITSCTKATQIGSPQHFRWLLLVCPSELPLLLPSASCPHAPCLLCPRGARVWRSWCWGPSRATSTSAACRTASPSHSHRYPSYRSNHHCIIVVSMKRGIRTSGNARSHSDIPPLLTLPPLNQWNSKCLRRL